MPRGGRRPGAGRKPKSLQARVLAHPSAPPPTTNPVSPVEEFDAPDSLLADARAVWLKQAPHAFRHGTLTRSTALSFERYCDIVVSERRESLSSAMNGPNHRGLLKQINTYELQFLLTPNGRSVVEPGEAAAAPDQSSKLARFRK